MATKNEKAAALLEEALKLIKQEDAPKKLEKYRFVLVHTGGSRVTVTDTHFYRKEGNRAYNDHNCYIGDQWHLEYEKEK